MDLNLIIPSFIAGIFTFLAPCTLPLVPGYLAFISGVSLEDVKDPAKIKQARLKIFLNGVFYVIGFSVVFIILGSLFGLGGQALIRYRIWLGRIGGIFVIFFGLFMMNIIKLPLLSFDKGLRAPKALKPGNPWSSTVLGATFAFGWTPCVGPILGSILLLASTSASVITGAFLLFIFSLGLAVPFLAIALGIGSASKYLSKLGKFLKVISFIGGIFLIFIGILLLTDRMAAWISFFFQFFNFINYEQILDLL